MKPEKARAIIAQALIEEIYEGPIPEEDEKAIEEAQKLIDLARDAWDQFVRGSEVEAILRIADDEFAGETTTEPESEIEEVADEGGVISPWGGYADEKLGQVIDSILEKVSALSGDARQDFLRLVWEYETHTKSRQGVFKCLDKLAANINPEEPEEDEKSDLQTPSSIEDSYQAVAEEEQIVIEPVLVSNTDNYHSVLELVDNELAKDKRHFPEPPETDVPELPWDWTKCSDKEIQNLYSYYSLLAYYKSFMLVREDRIALECRRAAEEIANELLKAIEKYDNQGKHKTLTLLEKEVEADPNVSNWRRLQRRHEAYVASARRERDSLYKLVESLSRFETMRQQEWQRSGNSNYK